MKKYQIELTWGLLFTLTSLIWVVIEKLLGWYGNNIEQHATLTNLFAIPAIAIYVLALRDKRKKDLGGVMSWKQGFITGLLITLVVVVLSPLTQILTHRIIAPEYFPNIIEYTVSTNQLTQAEAETYFNLKNYIPQSMLGALVMGIITSAVVAVFTRKKNLSTATATA